MNDIGEYFQIQDGRHIYDFKWFCKKTVSDSTYIIGLSYQ